MATEFTIKPLTVNNRVQEITLSNTVVEAFKDAVFSNWDVQAIQYKPFLRFAVADILDKACDYQLSKVLHEIMHDRNQAAFIIKHDSANQQGKDNNNTESDEKDFYVLLSTAISHLIGLPNHDSMYGSFYARFVVENKDDSDSYLRQAHRRLELHNDGTYVDERTDFVLMMKMDEQNMQGGETTLLHVDDWQDLERFYDHPVAKQEILWGSPKSKNVSTKVSHPIFFEEDANNKPHMLFIDQFAEPENMEQGLYLYEMGKSLEADSNAFSFDLAVGSMVVIQNHCWLHGREKFVPHPELKRELLRQRGHFTSKSTNNPYK